MANVFSKEEKSLLVDAVDNKIAGLRRAKAKSVRPQFVEVYDAEIAIFERLKVKVGEFDVGKA